MPYSSADLLAALPRLRRYVRFLTDDAAYADQLVEETVRRARHASFEARDVVPTVRLLGALRSVYADRFATSQPREPLSIVKPRERRTAITPPSAAHATPTLRERDDLVARLFTLPLDQREVLALVAVERLSYEETAALLDVPIATVFARLVQARSALHAIASDSKSAPESGR